jgi:hypothetical protein
MNIRIQDGLPFVALSVLYRERSLLLENVVLDTGSAGTILAADRLSEIGLSYAPDDEVRRIRGVGGVEFVFTKAVEQISVGELVTTNYVVEVGGMDYGFAIDGILGTDFLLAVGAVIDLAALRVYGASD